jgi:tRNA nucleotidyltransferase (CCA-adding enzyme)
LPGRFAVLTHRLSACAPAAKTEATPHALQMLCERWRIPADCRELAELVGRECEALRLVAVMGAEQRVRLLDRCDAWRRTERFELLLHACECIAQAEGCKADRWQASSFARWRIALARAATVDTGAVAARATAQGLRGLQIGSALHDARVRAVAEDLNDEIND